MNYHNNVWHPILHLAEKAGWKAPSPPQNWLATQDLRNLLHLAGWETLKHEAGILWPLRTPGWERLCNAILAPFLKPLCLTQFLVARPLPQPVPEKAFSCTVVIPARNESGNLKAAIERTPEMGLGTEILFIEGHSTDDTWERIQELIQQFPDRNIRALRQSGKGKGNAVREAFAEARGDLLFILDADLTMPPEQLPKFYEALRSGKADFVNGVRLVYPMEQEAMRFLNMVANHLFGLAFTWLIGQRVKDTLCGTKVLFRKDYERIAAAREYFGDFDPFGDFDLLFGASKLNLKILDLPIRYAARTYGSTNIDRWRDGALLFRMVGFALRKIKFIG